MLEVHHKDGDVTNIAVSNLETVCVNCHQREHNPGFLEGAQRYPGPGFREKHSTTAQARLERGINGEVSGESRNHAFGLPDPPSDYEAAADRACRSAPQVEHRRFRKS